MHEPAHFGQKENPVEAEAAEETHISVEWRGKTFSAPAPDFWPWDLYEAWDNEKFTHVIKELLGPDQYRQWKKTLVRPLDDAQEFMNLYGEAAGIDPGE